MPRRTRTHYFEAMYHVMLRGNYRQIIFNDDNDRLYFYSLLKQVTEKFNCKIHLFCLMTNHIHLVIEINHVPLWKIIQSFASSYARYINKKNKQSGHLFQGRYKAKLIQDDFSSIKMDDILKVICKNMKIPSAAIVAENYNRKVTLARSLFIYFAHYYANYFHLACFFLRNYQNVPGSLTKELDKSRAGCGQFLAVFLTLKKT